MSLLGHGGECVESTTQVCKRDIEREIRNAKAREDSYTRMLQHLIDVADDQFFYNISDNETKRSMAAMIGGATIEATRWCRNVTRLIEEQELEQEK